VFSNKDIFKDVPKALASYDGKLLSCNDMFSDITGISCDQITKHDILSIVKFDSFEGSVQISSRLIIINDTRCFLTTNGCVRFQ